MGEIDNHRTAVEKSFGAPDPGIQIIDPIGNGKFRRKHERKERAADNPK